MSFLILFLIFAVPVCIGMGMIFKKMNLDFKKGVIPFYNKIVLIKKFNLPQYHLILIFIPVLFLYTNFLIYKQICDKYNKNSLYVLELTFFPFIFNILLALDLKGSSEMVDETLKSETKEEIKVDDYVWHPKAGVKSDTVYKASRNKLNAKVNIKISKNDEIIYNKSDVKKKENAKVCPKCGSQLASNVEVCFVCGTKL